MEQRQADLLISLRMSLTVSLLVLIFISEIVAQDGWAVRYFSKSICAPKGSEVTMRCIYRYPKGHSVQKAFWTKEWGQGSEPPDLSDNPEYRGRVQYLRDEHNDCTLRLSDVREKDQSKYYFRFITDKPGGKNQGRGGVSVTDLQVEVPERVMEGDKVTLTCKTTCRLTVRPTLTWHRNGHRLSSRTDQLHLQPVSSEDAGRYRCGVLGQNLHSPEVTLNARYGPKNISVSISPSGEIVEGSSVTLTCSSDANPPVQNYTWFKGTSSVAEGETYTMKKISSVDSGEYKCRSSNEHGVKYSTALTLNVLYPPKSVSVSISPSHEIVEGRSETLTCSSDANPPVQNYTWFKEGGSSPVGSGHSYRAPHRGSYYCEAQNEHGSQKSAAVTVTVKEEQAMTLYVVVGVGLCGAAVFITITLLIWRKKKGMMDEDGHQNVDSNAKEDTYTALDPVSRSSDDVYSTLATVHSSPSDDLYSALDPQSHSPEYDTLATDLLISLRMSLTVSLLVLIFISGVVAQYGWSVHYYPKSVCALKGSTVTISCTYTDRSGYRVQKAFWTKEWGRVSEPPDLLDDPEYRGRVQYLGDEHSDCSLRFKTVTEKDQSKYYFTFITDQPGGKYHGRGGVDLSVTDLQVEVPDGVMEGDEVTFTCTTTCRLKVRPTFTWYRNGHPLSFSSDQLHLQSVRREDAGRYRCAVLDQNLHSPEVTLNVRCK
ncbi:hypothetical protein SRHO_G00180330 [Serrasalmus rhombeus]